MLEVVTPAAADARALASLDSVKADLRITVGTYDADLQRYIDEATAVLTRRADRVWHSERVRETLRLDRCAGHLILSRRPVTQIHSITVAGDALTTDDYERDGRRLYRLSSDERREWDAQKTVVEYTGGYDLAPAASENLPPADLARACRELVALRWFSSDRDPSLKAEEEEGIGRQEYWVGGVPSAGGDADGLSPSMIDLCWHYRYE